MSKITEGEWEYTPIEEFPLEFDPGHVYTLKGEELFLFETTQCRQFGIGVVGDGDSKVVVESSDFYTRKPAKREPIEITIGEKKYREVIPPVVKTEIDSVGIWAIDGCMTRNVRKCAFGLGYFDTDRKYWVSVDRFKGLKCFKLDDLINRAWKDADE